MNRERAETFLRLLAEAELRDPAPRRPPAVRPPGAPFVTMPVALAAGGLGADRGRRGRPGDRRSRPGRRGAGPGRAAPRPAAGGRTRRGPGPAAGPTGPGRAAGPSGSRRFARPGSRSGPARGRRPRAPLSHGTAPDRYVPAGRMILFHDETVSGELDLMSYAHTAAGARLVAAWQTRDPLASRRRGLPPIEEFTVTDDRGNRYDLLLDPKGRSRPDLRPQAPPRPAARHPLAGGHRAGREGRPRRPGRPGQPQIRGRPARAGGQRPGPQRRRAPAEPDRGPAARHGAGVPAAGDAGAAEQPGRGAGRHRRGARGGRGPVRRSARCRASWPRCARAWASAATGSPRRPRRTCPNRGSACSPHYQRRKPETRPGRGRLRRRGRRAAGAGRPPAGPARPAPLRRGHLDERAGLRRLPRLPARTAARRIWPSRCRSGSATTPGAGTSPARSGWYDDGGEAALTLRLAPPLTRSPDWIEVRAAGQSAEVRVTVPLRWGYRRDHREPNGPWFTCLPSCETEVPCGAGRHTVRWEAGSLRLPSHPDVEGELVLAALGGEKARCVELAEAWARHAGDLSVLAIGPARPGRRDRGRLGRRGVARPAVRHVPGPAPAFAQPARLRRPAAARRHGPG